MDGDLHFTRSDELRGDLGDKYAVESPPIDCASLIHLCKARCCRLAVPLDSQDLEDGLRGDDPFPNELPRRDDGYCVHAEAETLRCACYDKRPSICRSYDCREDKRVWQDFATQTPAAWRDDVDLPRPLVQIRTASIK